jgi:hypothetical protein
MNAHTGSQRQQHRTRATLSALSLAVMLGLGAGACALPGQLGAADAVSGTPQTTTTAAPNEAAARRTTTTSAPNAAAPVPTTSAAPAPAPAGRNATLWPFASDSPWNTPIGSGAALESASGALTSMIRSTTLKTQDGSSSMNMVTWMNADSYSHPVYTATNSDPMATISQTYGAPVTARVPASATPAVGTDKHMHVIQPDGGTIVEMWDVTRNSSTSLTAGRIAVVNLLGSGIGPDNGVRAYGGSAVGGLIRKWEVDPSDPNYTDGVIRHAIAIAVPNGMLKYTGGNAGYDAAGYGTAKGYVWPATEQDYSSPWAYYGTIPMGQLFTIPKSVNIDTLGLSSAARAVAKAMQDYGAYVTDCTGPGTVAFYAEPTVPSAWLGDVAGPNWSASSLTTIRKNLVAVTNNGPTSVGGGGSRPIASAPALG